MPSGRTGRVVGGAYRIGCRIGSGSFGDVYIGVHVQSGEEVAVKLEPLNAPTPRLLYEAKLCNLLAGGEGIPKVHWYGVEGDTSVMVIDLLGPSLEDLFRFCKRQFSLKTVLMLADQVLSRIEYIHAKGLIHQDIKPDNFVIGLGEKAHRVHMIDFGLAKRYRDPWTQAHVAYREGLCLSGTARFASLNAHLGVEQARRDDLESLGYMLVYLGNGRLPWQKLRATSASAKQEAIMQAKTSIPLGALRGDLPTEFATYLSYCRNLRFEQRPRYANLRRLLRDLFLREGYEYDFMFDWTIKAMGYDFSARQGAQADEEGEVSAAPPLPRPRLSEAVAV
mmetsp:Transcript_27141/g.77039  ORF Transcript_27141/g.77039 Transcript_27141/m.77039 type:complete len:336 (+) Transcript_27141:48-1055(+)